MDLWEIYKASKGVPHSGDMYDALMGKSLEGDVSDYLTIITDGTRTIYKLATPTTETADAFTSPQSVSKYGTEEYVTSNGVPVGHQTEYKCSPTP